MIVFCHWVISSSDHVKKSGDNLNVVLDIVAYSFILPTLGNQSRLKHRENSTK